MTFYGPSQPVLPRPVGQPVLRIGTRGSALALAQSGLVAAALAAGSGCRVELIRIRTEGDVNPGPLATIGGTGVFVTEVRARLAAGDVDVVVHSLKDLPTAPFPGLRLAAVPLREDPADALCARDGLSLAELPIGATVGTGSPRRAAQLLRLRPDLRIQPIRGNVDSRLNRVAAGSIDAVVLAAAGLTRLGRTDAITQRLAPDVMLPAPAQGALAVETRDGTVSPWLPAALTELDHPDTRAAVLAERSLLAALEAGCTAPVGAHATVADGVLTLDGAVVALDGSRQVQGRHGGPVSEAVRIGAELAAQLISDGAADLLGNR